MKEKEKFFKSLLNTIVSIDWRDSNMYITQCNIHDDLDISVITSIGKLVKVDQHKIVIAGDIIGESNDLELRRVISIPMENIIGLTNS